MAAALAQARMQPQASQSHFVSEGQQTAMLLELTRMSLSPKANP